MRIITNHVLDLVKSSDAIDRLGLRDGWIAVSWDWIDQAKDRYGVRGKWCRIKGQGGSTYRIIRFGGVDMQKNQIAIDWDGWLKVSGLNELGKPMKSASISIRRASLVEIPFCPLWHPDPAIRLSFLLALLSVILGCLSLTLAFML